MYKCNYCGRYLKEEYETCPGCGSSHLEKINNFGTTKITNIPQGGYKLNTKNITKELKNLPIFLPAGIFTTVLPLIITPAESEKIINIKEYISIFFENIGNILTLLLGLFITTFCIKRTIIILKKLKKLNKLKTTGILIKNMQCKILSTTQNSNNPIYCIEVEYENDLGVKITLRSEGKTDSRLYKKDGTVDLLIDPNDITNYFIDYEIY